MQNIKRFSELETTNEAQETLKSELVYMDENSGNNHDLTSEGSLSGFWRRSVPDTLKMVSRSFCTNG